MTKQRKSGKRPPVKKAPVRTASSSSPSASASLPALGSRRAWSATTRFVAVIVAVACVLFYMNIKDVYEAQTSALAATESTAQVTVELRKVEVNLTQLPRAMYQAGTELNELAAQLDRSTKKEEK